MTLTVDIMMHTICYCYEVPHYIHVKSNTFFFFCFNLVPENETIRKKQRRAMRMMMKHCTDLKKKRKENSTHTCSTIDTAEET